MLDFEEELKRFQPSLEIGNVEESIGKAEAERPECRC